MSSEIPFHNKVVELGRWFVKEFEDWWVKDKVDDTAGSLVPSSVELAYGMGTAAFNWLAYAVLGWDKAKYEVLATSEDMVCESNRHLPKWLLSSVRLSLRSWHKPGLADLLVSDR